MRITQETKSRITKNLNFCYIKISQMKTKRKNTQQKTDTIHNLELVVREKSHRNETEKNLDRYMCRLVSVTYSIEPENIPQMERHKRREICRNRALSTPRAVSRFRNFSWTRMPLFFLRNKRACELGPKFELSFGHVNRVSLKLTRGEMIGIHVAETQSKRASKTLSTV